MKLYVFKDLNYYIGTSLSDELELKAVILETEHQEGKEPIIKFDETGMWVVWVEGGDIDVDV